MHPTLGLEPAIGIAAVDLDGRRLDARFFALALLEEFDLVALLLGPARVHTQQHAGPVLALGAPGAGVDLEIAVVRIRLPGQKRLELATRDLRPQGAQGIFRIANNTLILLSLAELDQTDIVFELALDAGDRGQLIVERRALLHQALRALIVVPEIGIFGETVQIFSPPLRLVDVKDASSAVQGT